MNYYWILKLTKSHRHRRTSRLVISIDTRGTAMGNHPREKFPQEN